MTNIASKLKWAMGMLALAACIHAIPTFAASNGIYTATATSHYKHPITGRNRRFRRRGFLCPGTIDDRQCPQQGCAG